jgi:glycosyltransferase involved in cell wall biosynthesis
MKKRILFISEMSNLNTGFATYLKGILTELHKNRNYEIAELGCADNGIIPETPWKYYSNSPKTPEEQQAFGQRIENRFGAFRFEAVCLDFQPHIVISIMDYWMCSWINASPYRNYFKYIQKGVVDSEPLIPQWIDQFKESDLVIPYTNFAKRVIEKQCGDLVNYHDEPCGAGVDTEVFHPIDKAEARNSIGLDPDIFLVGMSSRNQHRKLYPNLFEAFRLFLDTYPKKVTEKAYLYVHSTWPDLGWNFPELLKRNSLSCRVIFTYICQHCGKVDASFFRGARSVCYQCHTNNSVFPSTHRGISREQLALIMNTFDIFVQYSSNEGYGLNQVEAASCGVPVMAPDYSGMSDVIENTSGMAIDILKYDVHIEFSCKRAIPDNKSFCHILANYWSDKQFGLDEEASRDARAGVLKYYTWTNVGRIWTEAIESLEVIPHNKGWGSPPDIHTPPNLPSEPFQNIEEFVTWAFVNILNQPDKVDSYFALRLITDLNNSMRPVTVPGSSYISENSSYGELQNNQIPFSFDEALRELSNIRENINQWETLRVSKIKDVARH